MQQIHQTIFDSLKAANDHLAIPAAILVSVIVPVIRRLGVDVRFKRITRYFSIFIKINLRNK